jgi:multiple sugar transport system permease protein
VGSLPVRAPAEVSGRRLRFSPAGAGVWLFLVVLGVVALFPFALMVGTSLKPIEEIFESGRLLPRHLTLGTYAEVFAHSLLLRYLLNGVIVTVAVLVGQLLVNIPAAYAFGKLSFPGREALFALVLAALVFPRYIAAVPNFLFLSRLRLIDTYPALILPFIGSPLGVFLMRQFFRQVPWEYFDAARLDGCSLSQMLRHVLIPLIRPAIGAFGIFSVVSHWNDFFWPLVVINTSKMLTPPAGIVYFADVEAGTRWNIVMAASVVIITPLLIAFIAARRQFISSLTQVTLKG